MQKLNTIIEAARNGLATSSTESGKPALSANGLPEHWVSAIFKKFQARYLHKWTSAIDGIELVAVREWSKELAGMTGNEIQRGLDEWKGDWPPTSLEFAAACRGNKLGLNEFGLDYVPEYHRPQPIREQARLLSSDERDARREAVKEKIKAMRDAIK